MTCPVCGMADCGYETRSEECMPALARMTAQYKARLKLTGPLGTSEEEIRHQYMRTVGGKVWGGGELVLAETPTQSLTTDRKGMTWD